MVMVHGLGGNALNWMDVGPGIAKHHHAVAVDLAGFGQTPLFNRSAAVGANAEETRWAATSRSSSQPPAQNWFGE